jgi:hypothetical protein
MRHITSTAKRQIIHSQSAECAPGKTLKNHSSFECSMMITSTDTREKFTTFQTALQFQRCVATSMLYRAAIINPV